VGYIREYRNGYYSISMIENADFVQSFDMIGVIAAPSSIRVLNAKSYSSSQRFYHFVKYRIPIKEPTRRRRKLYDRLAVLNLSKKSNIYDNVSNKEIENIIRGQIKTHQNNPS
jgi:hypothetical protein